MSAIIVLDTDGHKHRLIAANERALQLNLLAEDAGWNDLLGEFIDRTSGTDRPTLSMPFNGHHMLVWSSTALNQTTVNWHLKHDYKQGLRCTLTFTFAPLGMFLVMYTGDLSCQPLKDMGKELEFLLPLLLT